MATHNLLRESVLLKLVKGDEKINRNAIVTSLSQIIQVSDIDSLGNLGDFTEWYVICKSTTAREELLKKDELVVDEQLFIISEPYKHVKTIRLFNVPPSVSDDEIMSIASKWGGGIINIEQEKMPHPFEDIKTFVRRVRVRFSCRQDEEKVPLSFKYKGLNVPVYLEGRKKVCFRCKKAGHVKADCPVLICRRCRGTGHDDPDCRLRHTYAAAVISTPSYENVTPVLSEQPRDLGNGRTNERQGNRNDGTRVQKRICRRCKKEGHIKKDCPEQGLTETNTTEPPDGSKTKISGGEEDQTISPIVNNHLMVTTLTSNLVEEGQPDSPRINEQETNPILGKANATNSLDEVQVVKKNSLNTLNSCGSDQRKAYDDFKNPKRGMADRSIDSDNEVNKKKANVLNSSSSTLEEGEDVEGNI
jgi:hypothetical protein